MKRRFWTADEEAYLAEAIQGGLPTTQIARTLGRTYYAVSVRLSKLGISVPAVRQGAIGVRTANQVAALMGVSRKLVERWIADRELVAKRGTKKRGTHRLIADADLQSFLALRAAWPDWEPRHISDPDWRAAAEELRQAADGHWLATVEVGRQLYAAPQTVGDWVRTGRLPSMFRKGQYYVWSVTLAGFVPPLEQFTPERRSAVQPRRGLLSAVCARCGEIRTEANAAYCRDCRRAYDRRRAAGRAA